MNIASSADGLLFGQNTGDCKLHHLHDLKRQSQHSHLVLALAYLVIEEGESVVLATSLLQDEFAEFGGAHVQPDYEDLIENQGGNLQSWRQVERLEILAHAGGVDDGEAAHVREECGEAPHILHDAF